MQKKNFVGGSNEGNEQSGSAGGAGRKAGFGRREYLRLAGTTAASLAVLGGSGVTAAASDYGVIEVPAGERYVRRVGTGESFENTLVDVSARGAMFKLLASGRDWVVRNVGLKGRIDATEHEQVFNLRVADGGSALVENVYLGDGAVAGNYAPFFVPTKHAGTLTFRRVHVRSWPNNGLYASAPGRDERDGRNGVVRVEECYSRNNNIDGFRLGTDGSYIRDSVVHVDGDVPDVFGGKENARGIWIKEGGDVTIENCDVLLDHPDASICVLEKDDIQTGVARVIDSQVDARNGAKARFRGNVQTRNVGRDPDVTPPAGVPTSSEEAAMGGGSTLPNHLRIQGTGELAPYEFSVSGELEAGSNFDTDGTDGISGSTGSGRVNGTGDDDFYFSGRLTDFSHGGDLKVYVNDEQVNPDAFLAHDIRLQAVGERANYEFEVSGDLAPGSEYDTDGTDSISGSVGAGTIAGTSDDDFYFDGQLEYFEYDAPLEVYVDGEQVNPDELARPANHLRVQATGERANYEFSVSGDLAPGSEFDDDGTDSIDGSTGAGTIAGTSDDDFYFDGDLERFEYDTTLELYLNGRQVDPDGFGLARTLSIVGDGPRANYEFTVSGNLEKSTARNGSINAGDEISGSTASGFVLGGTDSYAFDGEVTDFTVDNPNAVTVYLDGEVIDPDRYSLPHEITISNRGFSEPATYRFTVSGDIQATDSVNVSDGDEIDGSSASGRVNQGSDMYRYSGSVTTFDNDGPIEVTLDGRVVKSGE